MTTRWEWIEALERCAGPVVAAMSEGLLRKEMPVEHRPESADRGRFSHLEALGRTLAGIAPWLELAGGGAEEKAARDRLRRQVQGALAHAVDPGSPDVLDFGAGNQTVVDAAFLGLGLLRGWSRVWEPLPEAVKAGIVAGMRVTRPFTPYFNNWLLFSAMVEVFLHRAGAEADLVRIEYALRQHEQWYCGDGHYGDGPAFHADYYNSFVIQPFLVVICEEMAGVPGIWQEMREGVRQRARRYAGVQERMIGADGTFPPLGRSLCYRFGVFHHLAQMALEQDLPGDVTPGGVRCGMTAVLRRLMQGAGVFDAGGWLRIGLAGHQPALGEGYISTGSLYLTCCGFLPLGLPEEAAFWADADASWTSKRIWGGENLPADHALKM